MIRRALAVALFATTLVACAQDATRKPGTRVRIELVGDSTQTDNAGYGKGFCANLTEQVDCVNMAKGGASTKTFRQDGLWDKSLATKPDYMLIQFGHNDEESAEHLPRQVPIQSYEENLERFVQEARAQGTKPVLVTPLTRRYFQSDGKIHSDLLQHAEVMKSVAKKLNVPLIDLQQQSIAYLDSIGEVRATKLGILKTDKEGKIVPDKTHLNIQGSYVFGRIVATSLGQAVPELARYIRKDAARAPGTDSSPKMISVSAAGRADFHTVQDAINHAPESGATIRISPGTYREKISISKPNIRLIGLGATPSDVVLVWGDSAKMAGGTGKSGSVSVGADGFAAENLTIANSYWDVEPEPGVEGAQAVALLMSSDRAILDRVRLLSGQDTLYANSLTCRTATTEKCQASRQFFNDCYIEGHVDYIFGDAKAVFNRCELHSRAHPNVMITAQSRAYPQKDSGYYFLHCHITGRNAGDHVALGRPWRDYSTVTFYDTQIDQTIAPQGWSDWDGRLKTSTYREYKSHGAGVNDGHRIVESPALTPEQENSFTPERLLAGTDNWNPLQEVEELRAYAQKGQ